jgi:hypothetical protein
MSEARLRLAQICEAIQKKEILDFIEFATEFEMDDREPDGQARIKFLDLESSLNL